MYDSFGSWLSGVHGFWNFREAEPLKVRAERIINMVAGLITKKKLNYRCFLCAIIFLHLWKLKENDDTCMYILSVAEASRSDSSTSRKRAIYVWLTHLPYFLETENKNYRLCKLCILVLRVNKLWKYSLCSFVCHCLSLIRNF